MSLGLPHRPQAAEKLMKDVKMLRYQTLLLVQMLPTQTNTVRDHTVMPQRPPFAG